MSNKIRVKVLPFAIAALLAFSSAHAQNTSSAVTGQVVDAQGKPVAGATVTIVNVPSGTTRVVTTDAKGNYNAQGLRVGGPFDITVKKDGMETSEKDGIYLKLAETSTLDFSIGVQAKELGAVTVTAAAMNTLFQPESRGLTTNVTQREIDTLPATGRSLQDYVRLDPMVNVNASGGISALGQNSRYNNINIDAVPTNDPFGLEAGGMPSLGQPISIDTISEINVSTNNYDVTNARNVGAQINAVTKSGTNQFHGDVYYVYLPKQWVGNGASDTPFTGFTKNTTAGFTLGGPIIKDKLFFFVAYEDQKSTAPAPDIGIIGSGKGSIVPITQAQLDQITQIAQGYGFATGSSQLGAPNTDEKRYLAKFDWNINNNHRIEFRYDRTKSNLAVISGRGGSGGYVNLASANYSQLRDFKNYVINTYDDWSDTFSSETSVSYGSYLRAPQLNGPLSPQVQVYVNGTSGPSVYMGTNYSYQANSLDTKTWTGFWAGTLFLNDHTVKFGVDFLRNNYNNLFLQYYAGGYQFTSIANFQAGNYSSYQLRQPSSGNLAD
ncbi:Outer membrane protein with a TonB box, partial [mine drainage metagenome]